MKSDKSQIKQLSVPVSLPAPLTTGCRSYLRDSVIPTLEQGLEELVAEMEGQRLSEAAGVGLEDGQFLPKGWRPFSPLRCVYGPDAWVGRCPTYEAHVSYSVCHIPAPFSPLKSNEKSVHPMMLAFNRWLASWLAEHKPELPSESNMTSSYSANSLEGKSGLVFKSLDVQHQG